MKKLFGTSLAVLLILAGCNNADTENTAEEASAEEGGSTQSYEAGTYEVEGEGYAGPVALSVEFSDSEILGISVDDHGETEGIGTNAIDQLPGQIVENQSLNVSAVTGATVTSEAIIAGVEEAVTEAGGDVEGLRSASVETQQEDIEEETNIVVIGGGGAGLSAAVSAAQEGSDVILVEKTSALGGNTIRAGGPLNAVDPERQQNLPAASESAMESAWELTEKEAQNDKHAQYMEELAAELEEYEASGADYLFDSVALHILQTYDGGDYEGDIDMIELICQNSMETIEWLEGNGVVWQDEISTVPGGLWPRAHLPENAAGADYINTNADLAEELGVEIIYDAAVEHLIMEDDEIVGVTGTTTDGADVTVRADQGVVVASGGFAANVDMRQEYNPALDESIGTTNSPAITGDGIVMGEEVGTNLIGMEHIQSLPLGRPGEGNLSEWIGGIGVEFYYQINQDGERFMPEDGRRDEMTEALLEQEDALSYVITGSNRESDSGETIWGDNIDELVEEGVVYKADTIEELAEMIDVNAENFVETHESFNRYVETGEDEEFGRDLFGDPIVAPFYASPRSPTAHHTMGGLEINLDGQVLDVEGNVIPGLYAAGEVTGGIHGKNRLGGNALLDIHVIGRIAGTNAAQEEAAE